MSPPSAPVPWLPAVTPPPVIRLPSRTTRPSVGIAPKAARRSCAAQCVVARLPRRSPAAPSTRAPVQTEVTGGGVTAGIDFGLTLAAELTDVATAKAIQLHQEYAPAPPFDAGRPETAGPEILAAARERLSVTRQEREANSWISSPPPTSCKAAST
jgi:hypothetical protein